MAIWQALVPFNQQLVLLVVVITLHQLLQSVLPHNPWQAFRLYCQQLAAKVNKPENGVNQQIISGMVAVVITFLPLWVIFWLFETLVALPELYHAFLLYIALGVGRGFSQARRIAKAVNKQNNYQAKQILAPLVLRETDNLSPLGINKAAIEMQILSFVYQYLTPSIIFLAFGPVSAVSYRLLLEMHYSWNTKLPQMRNFGRFIHIIVSIMTWLPVRIATLVGIIFALNSPLRLIGRLTSQYFFKLNANVLLGLIAYHHNIRLAGVAMYQAKKLRRASFNDKGHQPEAKDIIRTQRFLISVNIAIALTVFTFAFTTSTFNITRSL